METKKLVIRSYFDLHDMHFYEPGGGPMIVDQSCYESTQSQVARLVRSGEYPPKFVPEPAGKPADIEAAFAAADPTQASGFDLADIPPLQEQRKQAKQRLAAMKAAERKRKNDEDATRKRDVLQASSSQAQAPADQAHASVRGRSSENVPASLQTHGFPSDPADPRQMVVPGSR